MRKIISAVLLSIFTFNTIAAPLITSTISSKNVIVSEDILVDKSEQTDGEELFNTKSIETIKVSDISNTNKTFSNTKNIKIAPIDEEEKRKALLSKDPQVEKSNFDKIKDQNAKEADKNIDPAQFGLGKAGAAVSESAEGYLNSIGGTSKVTVSGGDGFQTGSVDVLVPLHKFYDSDKHLFFTQFGARKSNFLTESYRTTLNLGLGYRYFTDDNWMFGINTFYDHDVTRGHQRMGFGAEAWTDNLKLSANSYMRLSQWKDSPDLLNYQERPANGFDVRAEGSLPNYPQLGGKVMYEKYYGDEVGLFGESTRQKDPSAVTVGLNYTPVPLLTIGLDHRMGQNGKHDTKFNVGMNYEIGTPLSQQLDSTKVGQKNQLKMNRTGLVERNNEIVLEYKLKPTGSIQLPQAINGNPSSVITFPIVVTTNTTLNNFTWTGTASPFVTTYNGGGSGMITLPVYSSTTPNTYSLQLTANDASGRSIQSNLLTITVDGLTLTVTRSKAVANANGTDSIVFTATLKDKNNSVVPNKPIGWVARNAIIQSSDATTNANGEATATVTSLVSSLAEVDAVDTENGTVITTTAQFSGDPATASVSSVSIANPSVAANGTSSTTISAIVKDSNGNTVVAGVPVSWTTTLGTLSGSTSNTDANGVATITLVSPLTTGIATVTAKGIAIDVGKTGTVNFVADSGSAKTGTVSSSAATLIANGTSQSTLNVQVTDANGNIVGSGVVVNWTTTAGTLSGLTSTTNASGIATITLTSGLVAGVTTVTAKTANDTTGSSTIINFTADTSTAKIRSVVVNNASVVANGVSSSIATAIVEDANGNLVSNGVTVNWTTTLGTLSGSTSTTNTSGVATITLTSGLVSGNAIITSKGSSTDAGKTANVSLIANSATSKVDALTSVDSTLIANGTSSTILFAKVTDSNNNELGAGVTVNWTTTGGTLSSATSVTNTNGFAVITLISATTVGSLTVSAKSSTSDTGKSKVITMIADNLTAKVDALSQNNASIVANGVTTSTITATVTDGNGNAVSAGLPVTWVTTAGSLSAPTTLTNASGVATVILTSSISVTTATITAKRNISDIGKTITTLFTADTSTSKTGSVTASSNLATAGNNSPITISANMLDANNNPLGAGITVNWTTTLGTLSGVTSVTNASGVATITFTPGNTSGTAIVTAKGVISDGGKTTSIVVSGNIATAKVSNVSATDTNLVANGLTNTTISSTIVDANNNPLGAGVTVNWTTTLGTLSGATSVTNASGIASIVLTSATTAGTANVTAKGIVSDMGMTASVTFTANTATARVTAINAQLTTLIANGVSSTTVSATVQDANSNAVGSGVPVNWSVSSGTLTAATTNTNASGVATVTYTSSTTAGVATVTGKGQLPDAGLITSITLTADTSSANVSTLTTDNSFLFSNGTSQTIARAIVKDANGNNVGAGITVNWTTSLGTLNSATSVTNTSSEAVITLTSGTVSGQANLTAKTSGVVTRNASVQFTADISTAQVSAVSSGQSSVVAGSTTPITLSSTVTDLNGNNVGAGVTVNWTTTLGTLSSASSVTNTSGIATVSLTAPLIIGTTSILAKTTATDAGKTTSISIVSDNATAKVDTLNSSLSSIVADGVGQTLLSAVVRDANNNIVGSGVTVNWTTTGGTLSAVTSTTNVSGVATILLTSSTTAGNVTVTAKGSVNDTAGKTTVVTLIANTTNAIVSSVNSSATNATAGIAIPITLTSIVTDANGNALGSGVTVNWTTTSGTLSGATSTTNASGVATITFVPSNNAGTAIVTAKGAVNDTVGKSASIAIVSNTATAKVDSLTGSSSINAGGATTTLTATLTDANNNPLGAGITVNWTTTLGTLSGATSTTNASGVATMILTSSATVGTATVTAKGSASDTVGKTFNTTFVANASTATVVVLNASVSPVVANNSTSTLSATVQDANGNSLGAGITVNWTTTRGTLASNTSTTNASGVATVVLNAGSVAGQATLTAKASGTDIGQTVNINFIPDILTARVNTFGANFGVVTAGSTTPIMLTASVSDANGNGLSNGYTVNWTASLGTLSVASTLTNSAGNASATLMPSLTAGISNLTATVATTGDTGKTDSVIFVADADTAVVSTVTVGTPTIVANGVAQTMITAQLKDANGNNLGAGNPVSWTTNLGTLSSATTNTNSSGIATVTFTSGTTSGVATVTVKGIVTDPGKTGTVTLTGNPATAVVTSGTNSTPTYASATVPVLLTAIVKDANGNAVGSGITVNWTTTKGTLSSATSLTDANGTATMNLIPSTTNGPLTATAKVGSTTDYTYSLSITSDPATYKVSSVDVPPAPRTVSATVPLLMKATVTDNLNNPVGAGIPVVWTTSSLGGSFSSVTTLTDASGFTTVNYIPGTVSGFTVINAKTGTAFPGNIAFFVTADPVSARVTTLTPSSLNTSADGSTQTAFTATVVDGYGNSFLTNGANIAWETTAGTLSNTTSAIGGSSQATITLTAPSTASTGTLTVKGNPSDIGKTSSLTFTSMSESHAYGDGNYYIVAGSSCDLVGGYLNYVPPANAPSTIVWNGSLIGSNQILPYTIGGYTYSRYGSVTVVDYDDGGCDSSGDNVDYIFGVTRTPA